MRKQIVAGNWKMNTLNQSGKSLVSEVVNMVNDEAPNQAEVLFFPPYLFLQSIGVLIPTSSRFSFGAQNCFWEETGAFTGEVSAEMIKDVGGTHVIIGHSERRAILGETNAMLSQKTSAGLRAGLTVIYCCGETLEERKSGKLFEIIEQQIVEGLFHLIAADFSQIVIAYEPVWAIGTGETATKEQAQEMHAFIRNLIFDKYGKEVSDSLRILYGGSVKPDNAADLFGMPDIDGGLIGGASLQSRSFTDIVKAAH